MILIFVFVVVGFVSSFLAFYLADCAHGLTLAHHPELVSKDHPESIEGRFCAPTFPRKREFQDFPAQGLDARPTLSRGQALRGHDDSDMRRHSAIY